MVLYYQGRCRKCQIISYWVVAFSLWHIKRIPLEWDEGIQFFYEEFPKAQGMPILFIRKRPIYGYWVLAGVPFGILFSWIEIIGKVFTPWWKAKKNTETNPI